jgi:hypothetical protein
VNRPLSIAALWRRALLKAQLEPFEAAAGKVVSPYLMKSVGTVLAEYANKDGEAFPSARTLAKGLKQNEPEAKRRPHLQVSERTIVYALDGLVAGGWLTVVRERPGSTTVYRLTFPNGSVADVTGLAGLHDMQGSDARGLHQVQGSGVHDVQGGLNQVQGGLHDMQRGPAPGAPEVGSEVEAEEVQELGHVQLELEEARPSVAPMRSDGRCRKCSREGVVYVYEDKEWCATCYWEVA